MLRLRGNQIESLSRESFRRVLNRWAREFRKQFPEQTSRFSDPEFRELLERGTQEAAGYGLAELFYIRDYSELVVRFGSIEEGVPADGRLLAILEDSALSETAKMDRIAAALDEMDPEEDEEEDGDLDPPEAEDQEDDGDLDEPEPDLPTDPKFNVPADPDELETELSEEEENIAW